MADIIKELISDYLAGLSIYQKMKDYYDGQHDILSFYKYEEGRSNQKTVVNYVNKFVEEELAYCFGNPLTYTSKSGNDDEIKAIDYNFYHWKSTHNQELMRQLEIYGTAYELYYIDQDGLFSGRILNPTDAIAYTDADGIPQIFVHFYKMKYTSDEYFDVYYPDRIEIYKNGSPLKTKSHIFNGVPVSICCIGEDQTIYRKIKALNDSLNLVLSDQINLISDYRNAYLVVSGAEVDEETATLLKTKGILNINSKDGKASWLIKNIDSTYIDSIIREIKDSIYSTCNHIDGQEKLQSNTSGVALRTRLVFLEQRCKTVFDCVSDTIYDRIKFLFYYLSLKNLSYDWKDIAINFNPCIPQDLAMIAQVLTQLDGKISLETALSQVPFIENPAIEIAKIKKERAELEQIDLDKINGVA